MTKVFMVVHYSTYTASLHNWGPSWQNSSKICNDSSVSLYLTIMLLPSLLSVHTILRDHCQNWATRTLPDHTEWYHLQSNHLPYTLDMTHAIWTDVNSCDISIYTLMNEPTSYHSSASWAAPLSPGPIRASLRHRSRHAPDGAPPARPCARAPVGRHLVGRLVLRLVGDRPARAGLLQVVDRQRLQGRCRDAALAGAPGDRRTVRRPWRARLRRGVPARARDLRHGAANENGARRRGDACRRESVPPSQSGCGRDPGDRRPEQCRQCAGRRADLGVAGRDDAARPVGLLALPGLAAGPHLPRHHSVPRAGGAPRPAPRAPGQRRVVRVASSVDRHRRRHRPRLAGGANLRCDGRLRAPALPATKRRRLRDWPAIKSVDRRRHHDPADPVGGELRAWRSSWPWRWSAPTTAASTIGDFVAFVTTLLMTISRRCATSRTSPSPWSGGLVQSRACFDLIDEPSRNPITGTRGSLRRPRGHLRFEHVTRAVHRVNESAGAGGRRHRDRPPGRTIAPGRPLGRWQDHAGQHPARRSWPAVDPGRVSARRRRHWRRSARHRCANSSPWSRRTSCSSTAASPRTSSMRSVPRRSAGGRESASAAADLWDFVMTLASRRGRHAHRHQRRRGFPGGQRQRLAIARALYKECAHLGVRRSDVFARFRRRSGQVHASPSSAGVDRARWMLVAHRLSTVRPCRSRSIVLRRRPGGRIGAAHGALMDRPAGSTRAWCVAQSVSWGLSMTTLQSFVFPNLDMPCRRGRCTSGSNDGAWADLNGRQVHFLRRPVSTLSSDTYFSGFTRRCLEAARSAWTSLALRLARAPGNSSWRSACIDWRRASVWLAEHRFRVSLLREPWIRAAGRCLVRRWAGGLLFARIRALGPAVIFGAPGYVRDRSDAPIEPMCGSGSSSRISTARPRCEGAVRPHHVGVCSTDAESLRNAGHADGGRQLPEPGTLEPSSHRPAPHPQPQPGRHGRLRPRPAFALTDDRVAPRTALFMDDDASCETESIARTLALLQYAKEPRLAVAGALLREIAPWELLEKGARFEGRVLPLHAGLDMRRVGDLLESERSTVQPSYGAWWFFAFPIVEARQFPFPFFVRGDDIFFGLANNFDIATLNGVACLGEDFSTKHGPMTAYLDARYHLVHAMLAPRGAATRIFWVGTRLFVKALTSYHYASARAVTLAIRHVLQGPTFFRQNLDMQAVRREIGGWTPDEKMRPVQRSDFELKGARLGHESKPRRLLRLLTLQGFLLPGWLLLDRTTLQEKSFHGQASAVFRYRRVLYEHAQSGTGYVASFDRPRFFSELGDFLRAWLQMFRRLSALRLVYIKELPGLSSAAFWRGVYDQSWQRCNTTPGRRGANQYRLANRFQQRKRAVMDGHDQRDSRRVDHAMSLTSRGWQMFWPRDRFRRYERDIHPLYPHLTSCLPGSWTGRRPPRSAGWREATTPRTSCDPWVPPVAPHTRHDRWAIIGPRARRS